MNLISKYLAALVFLLAFVPTAIAADISDLTNFRVHTKMLASSGQPNESQIAELPDAGIEVVINLSPASVSGTLEEEEALVVAQGMRYFYIPVDWDAPSLEDFEKFLAAMDESNGTPVLAHCLLNARSSAFVYLYRVIKEGAPMDQEYAVLEEIWENNKGYELRNVRHWRRFIDMVMKRYK